MADFEQAFEQAQKLMDDEGVDAVGEGEEEGRRVIDVWVRHAELRRSLPPEINGVPVRVRDSGGPISAHGEDV